jgi:hypothetical protein
MRNVISTAMLLIPIMAMSAPRYQSFPKLSDLIEEMRTSASEGASLAYFDFVEGLPNGELSLECGEKSYSAAGVIGDFSGLADQMFEGGVPTRGKAELRSLKKEGLAELKKLLGKDSFRLCTAMDSGRRGITSAGVYVGSNYTLSTLVGHED